MRVDAGPASVGPLRSLDEVAWNLVLAASALAHELDARGAGVWHYGVGDDESLCPVEADAADILFSWHGGAGWSARVPTEDPRAQLFSLYLPFCGATAARPVTLGHLGQSLDGFIATPSGDSQFVTGSDNLVHAHRLRALSDAVVVGAGTVAADNPQLTTRLVSGPNPLRVVFDPERRLQPTYRVFTDGAAPTLYVCDQTRVAPGEERVGQAEILGVDCSRPGLDAEHLLRRLRQRGCARVFIEGGGVTVSRFLEANLLDRLQIAVAPVLIGEGRPAIRLRPQTFLRDCRRPAYRVFRMGSDVLFECDFRSTAADVADSAIGPVSQII